MNTTSYSKVSKLPQIPNKRYFTIGEVGFLCGVKPHVLRYWEQEFPQLKPAKRRGNRRYYQREDVLMVRNIRGLLYDEGYTISGARIQLDIMLRQANQDFQQNLPETQEDSALDSYYDNNNDHNYDSFEPEITSAFAEPSVRKPIDNNLTLPLTDLSYLSKELREISNSFTVLEAFVFHDNSVNTTPNYCDSTDLKYIAQQLTSSQLEPELTLTKPAELNPAEPRLVSKTNQSLKLKNYKLTIEDVIFELSDLLTEIQSQQVATV